MRAASTVVDVSVFLLLVGVAITTLALSEPATEYEGPDETSVLLASSTTEVAYDALTPGHYDDEATVEEADANRSLTVHGTYAGLIGRAALSNVSTADGDRLWSNPRFSAAVTDAAETLLDRRPGRHQVRATWEPYPGAPVAGRYMVGAAPPPGVDVTATTLTVPVHVDSAVPDGLGTGPDGYDEVAAFVADRTVESVFETDRGVARPTPRNSSGVARAAIVSSVRDDLAERFDSPTDAREAIDLGGLTVTVRGWDP